MPTRGTQPKQPKRPNQGGRTAAAWATNESCLHPTRKEQGSMRFIPTRLHAPLDYIVGAVLIAAPWVFQFSGDSAATAVSIVLGIGLIAYSLFTNYELGVWKVAPMAVHNLIDIVAGALLAASPWIFGFADHGAIYW